MQTARGTDHTGLRRLRTRALGPIVLAFSVLLVAEAAHADDIERALDTDAKGQRAVAIQSMKGLVESGATSGEDLLRIARIAAGWQDEALLGALRSRIEPQAAKAPDDVHLQLAQAYTYIGISEARIAAGTAGSAVAFMYSDADTITKRVLARPDLEAETRAIARAAAARSRYDQGDLEGALAQLRPSDDADESDELGPVLVLRGLYAYAKALKLPADDKGYPTPEARKAFALAGELLARAIDEDPPEDPALAWRAARNAAWAFHRVGNLDAASLAYRQAYSHIGGDLDASRRRQLLRGLSSLYTRYPEHYQKSLEVLRLDHPNDLPLVDALIVHHAAAKRYAPALETGALRIELAPQDVATWVLVGQVLEQMGQIDEAANHYAKAIQLDASNDNAAFRLESLARSQLQPDFERAMTLYDKLLELRPHDPYARNNLGFILREWMTPHTVIDQRTQEQSIKEDAPPLARKRLERCKQVYAEAVALIPEAEDGTREFDVAWNLAGIINDYALMLHYFRDIRDALQAEQLYLRALRMTEDGFKDTYAPNMQRLYAFVLPHRELAWYRLAKRCKDKILKEAQTADGSLDYVDDEAKQRAAARDEQRLRARLLQELGADAPKTPDSQPDTDAGGDDR